MDRITITSLLGNRQWLDGGAMFGNAPRLMWERWETSDSSGRILLECRCFLIQWNGRRILLESGIGNFFDPNLATRYGVDQKEHVLLKNLKTLGVKPQDITDIILSHLHFDHAGGILKSYDQQDPNHKELLFENAQYYVSKEAWLRAKHPHARDRASFIPGLCELLESTSNLHFIEAEANHEHLKQFEKLPDFLGFSISNGHTPGHMHTWVRGAHSWAVFAGDLVPGCSWVHLPITMGYDRFAELVIDEKEKFYKNCIKNNAYVLFTHDSKVSAARIVLNDKKRFEPNEKQPSFENFSI